MDEDFEEDDLGYDQGFLRSDICDRLREMGIMDHAIWDRINGRKRPWDYEYAEGTGGGRLD